MDRDLFIEKISKAVASGRAHRVSVRDDINPKAGYVGQGEESVVDCFVREVNEVGGEAIAFTSQMALIERLNELLEEYQPKSALIWQHPICDQIQLTEILQQRKIESITYNSTRKIDPSEKQDLLFKADLGITSCSYALAETGTLAVFSEPGQERVTSLLPMVHIAIVDQSQIIPDLFDLFPTMSDNDQEIPSNLSLITGPSKTGDIELTLTTGVHGPGKLFVLVLNESENPA
jgi:L-lactate dehydrogenase complex protein LldG